MDEMSGSWYGGGDTLEDSFGDGINSHFDQAWAALNGSDSSTQMNSSSNIAESSYPDASHPTFAGTGSGNFADEFQFASPHGSPAFEPQLSIPDRSSVNTPLFPGIHSPTPGHIMSYDQLSSQNHMSPYTQPSSYGQPSFNLPYGGQVSGHHTPGQSTSAPETTIKEENSRDRNAMKQPGDDDYLPELDGDDSDYEDHSTEPAGKKQKLNKDGRSRKVRQPRGQLRRWDDTDIHKAFLGVVWACGENGVSIPFAQAAKIIGPTCTASALQQAILKIWTKLNNEGAQIPKIKMNWPKKNEAGAEGKTGTRDTGKVPRKKPTLTQGTQCNITSLRGSTGQRILATAGLGHTAANNIVSAPMNLFAAPVHIAPGANNITNTQGEYAQLSRGAGLPLRLNDSTQSAWQSRRRTHAEMMAEGRSTPLRPQRSPVCPPAPRLIRAARPTNGSPARRLFPEASESHFSGFGSMAQGRMSSSFTPFNLSGYERNGNMFSGMQGFGYFSGPSTISNPDSTDHDATAHNSSSMEGVAQDCNVPGGPCRKDSLLPSNAQSANSSQNDRDPQTPVNQDDRVYMGPGSEMSQPFRYPEEGIRQQNADLIARLNAVAAGRPSTAQSTRPTFGFSRQQRPQLSLGIDTLANPFGGTFGDVLGTAFHPTGQDVTEETELVSSPSGSAFPEVSAEVAAGNNSGSLGAETLRNPEVDNPDGVLESPVTKADSSPIPYDFAGAYNML